MRVPNLLLALLVLVSCYEPDLSKVRYRCDSENPICPAGLSCVSGYCQAGGASVSSDGGAPDMTISVSDASGPQPDLAAADLAGAPATGCAAGRTGFKVGEAAYACRGTFDRGRAQELCNTEAGYLLCENGQGIDPSLCPDRGFFAARATACRRQSTRNYACAAEGGCTSSEGWNALLVGCGRRQGSTTLYPEGKTCSGLRTVLECIYDIAWDCRRDGITGEQAANRDAESGVLCCKKP